MYAALLCFGVYLEHLLNFAGKSRLLEESKKVKPSTGFEPMENQLCRLTPYD